MSQCVSQNCVLACVEQSTVYSFLMENFDILRLDGHTLRVFLSVCETGSISQTAAAFNLNQSTISHTVEKMRTAVGDPLFVKAGRGITPTETALGLMPRVEKLIAELQSLAVPGSYDPATDTRRFILGIQTPSHLQDVKLIQAKLEQAAPQVRFELRRVVPKERIPQMLQDREVDLAIVISGATRTATLNHRPYGQDEMAIFYDPKRRGPIESVEAYSDAKHGVVDFGGGGRSMVETSLERLGYSRDIALVSPTASMLGDLLLGTEIIATMPRRLADYVYKGLAHCPVPLELPPIYYDILWHRRDEHSGRSIWLRQMIDEVGRELYGQASMIGKKRNSY